MSKTTGAWEIRLAQQKWFVTFWNDDYILAEGSSFFEVGKNKHKEQLLTNPEIALLSSTVSKTKAMLTIIAIEDKHDIS